MNLNPLTLLTKVTDPGGLVKEAMDTVLPKELHAVSDAVAMAVDLSVAEEIPLSALSAAKHGMDLLKDFKDLPPYLAKTLSPSTPNATSGWLHEPPPPPPRAPSKSAGSSQTKVSAWHGKPPATHSSAFHGSPVTPPTATPPSVNISNVNTNQNNATATAPPVSSAAPAPQSNATAPATPQPSATAAPQNNAAAKTTPPPSAAPTQSTADPTSLATSAFMKLSDDDFMNAIKNGKIPKEIENSPTAMMQLQQRMNDITQMNQLMTSMLQALHQMNMAIIQNVRV